MVDIITGIWEKEYKVGKDSCDENCVYEEISGFYLTKNECSMGKVISLVTIFASNLPTAFIVIEAYLINKLLDGFHQVCQKFEL